MVNPDQPIYIDEHLYLGNFSSATYDALQKNKITSVVCLTKDKHDYPPEIKLFHIDDISEDLSPESFALKKLESAVDFIEQQIDAGENVLVHCMAGACRSPTVIIAYIIKKRELTVTEACNYVKQRASYINPTYMDLLDQYYYSL